MSSDQGEAMPTRPVMAMGATEWGFLLALSILWGGTYFFAKVAVAALPPLTVVLVRVAIAAVALLAVVKASGLGVPRNAHLWRTFLVMGAINNVVPFGLLFWAQTEIASGLAAILNATTPLFTVLFAQVAAPGERLTLARLGGVLCGCLGVTLLVGPDALSGLGNAVLAQLACLAAAVSYAVAGLFGRRFRGVPAPVTAFGQVAASTVLTLPLVLVFDRPWTLPAPGLQVWGALIGLGTLGTALAYILYFRILAAAGATNLLLVTFLIPVSAIALGTIFLGETLDARHFAGMATIGLGLAAIDGRVLAVIGRRFSRDAASASATGISESTHSSTAIESSSDGVRAGSISSSNAIRDCHSYSRSCN